MIKRREFITLLGGAAAWPLEASAQQDDRVRALYMRVLRLLVESTADKIVLFIREIETQVGWTTQGPWSAGTLDQWRFEGVRLLRLPAITEFAQLDPSGKEQLRVSRAPNIGPKCIRARPSPAQAEVGGLGVGVTMRDGLIKVVTPIDKTPAAKAGILANDIITALDDEPVQGLTLDQVVQKMRGAVNTKITLTIVRMGQDKPIEITIIRESIRVPATVSRDTSIDPDLPAGCPDQVDMSKEPKFSVAMAKGVYYSPVYFGRSQPYMTLSRRGTGRDAGVSVVEINLKFVWDVISSLRVGEHGLAYMVDADGKLIAYPDLSLVLANTDLSGLAQVRAARAAGPGPTQARTARDINGRDVLSASASVAGPGWHVFAELPLAEADTAVP